MDLIDYLSFLNSVLFILTIYEINLEGSEAFCSLMELNNNINGNINVLIYDNSKSPCVSSDLLQVLQNHCNIFYVHDQSNPGVSKAYNEGCRLALKLNKKWLFLLDQDTQFKKTDIILYHESVSKNQDIDLFAPVLRSTLSGIIYSPCRYIFKKGFELKQIQTGRQKLSHKSVLSSGLLVDSEVFNQLGGYNERLKLDFSDFEFIDRYRQRTSLFFVVPCCFEHNLSSSEQDISKVISRFKYYCEATKELVKEKNFSNIMFLIFVLFRTLKLSINHKRGIFLSIYVSCFQHILTQNK